MDPDPDPDRTARLEHAAALGRAMRTLQVRWFAGDKSTATLHDAKKAERAFDAALAALDAPAPQGTLF